jgi:hypothetical protein
MPYLVPDTEIAGTGVWNPYGTGASNVERINTAPTSDTSNGIKADTNVTPLGTIAYGLTNPSISVNTSADVKIGVIAGAEDPLGLGTFTCDLILKQGGISGTTIATLTFVRDIDSSAAFSGSEATLTVGEKAAVSNWTDLCLVLGTPNAGIAQGNLYISEIWLEYTEGAGPGSNTRKRSHLMLMGCG